MTRIRLLSALALLIATLCPAFAADTVFPPGIRVGLTPLVGLALSKSFLGFETEDHTVKVLVAELPPAAYTEVSNTFKAETANNIPGPKTESIETAAGTAYYTIECSPPRQSARRFRSTSSSRRCRSRLPIWLTSRTSAR
jgi:hypothetical protein